MPLSREDVVQVCDAYIAAMSAHDPDRTVRLFAPTATHEEPIGTPARTGHDEIRAFLATHADLGFLLRRIGPVTVVGNRGAFQVRVDVPTPDGRWSMTATDLVTVDEGGLICGIYPTWRPIPMGPECRRTVAATAPTRSPPPAAASASRARCGQAGGGSSRRT